MLWRLSILTWRWAIARVRDDDKRNEFPPRVSDHPNGVQSRAKIILMPDKDDVATELIQHHFAVEPELREVYRLLSAREDAADEPIKLLEVSAATPASGSVEVFGFAPTQEVPFAVQIAEITPEELESLQKSPELLPEGWNLGEATLFQRPRAAE